MPVWGGTTYPLVKDNFGAAPQADGIDVCFADHPNSLGAAIDAIQTKLAVTTGVATGFGGMSLDSAGKAANPGAGGDPTIWVDNTGGPGFPLMYTDDVGTSFNLLTLATPAYIGYTYNVAAPLNVGDIVALDSTGPPDTVIQADATLPAATGRAIGVAINIYGGGLLCDVLYAGEFALASYNGLFPHGTSLYLGVADGGVPAFHGLAAAPPGGLGTVIQELGFVRGTAPETFVFNPTTVSVI